MLKEKASEKNSAKMSTPSPSPSEQFGEVLDDILKDVESIIKELHRDRICDISPNIVVLARGVISKYNKESVILAVAKIHPDWKKVIDKSSSFVTNDLNGILKAADVPLDASLLSIPLICFDKISASPEWKAIPYDEWPVIQEDLDDVWAKFHTLLKITCSWVKEERDKISKVICIRRGIKFDSIDSKLIETALSTPIEQWTQKQIDLLYVEDLDNVSKEEKEKVRAIASISSLSLSSAETLLQFKLK